MISESHDEERQEKKRHFKLSSQVYTNQTYPRSIPTLVIQGFRHLFDAKLQMI